MDFKKKKKKFLEIHKLRDELLTVIKVNLKNVIKGEGFKKCPKNKKSLRSVQIRPHKFI